MCCHNACSQVPSVVILWWSSNVRSAYCNSTYTMHIHNPSLPLITLPSFVTKNTKKIHLPARVLPHQKFYQTKFGILRDVAIPGYQQTSVRNSLPTYPPNWLIAKSHLTQIIWCKMSALKHHSVNTWTMHFNPSNTHITTFSPSHSMHDLQETVKIVLYRLEMCTETNWKWSNLKKW
jgi:hypothetical protein